MVDSGNEDSEESILNTSARKPLRLLSIYPTGSQAGSGAGGTCDALYEGRHT